MPNAAYFPSTAGIHVEKCFARILKARVGDTLTASEIIAGGGNSQVYKLTTRNGKVFIGKHYFSIEKAGDNPRLCAEYDALQFLCRHHIGNIPLPIGVDHLSHTGVYTYIQGQQPDTRNITKDELSQAVRFLSGLHRLSKSPEAGQLKPASDACLTLTAYKKSVDRRLDEILNAIEDDRAYGNVLSFLKDKFLPTAKEVFALFDQCFDPEGSLVAGQEIEPTLSPSDFGFHNTLRSDSGELFFLDFEYFGWDDPAKMIVDFLHHPAMELNEAQYCFFVDTFLAVTRLENDIRQRIKAIYPIVGLKWCLLLLNICTPDIMARKQFADFRQTTPQLIDVQLEKAKTKLEVVQQWLKGKEMRSC